MLTAVRPDSCIAMTACTIEVLKVFGFEAKPMNVECILVNEKFQELCDAGKIRVDEKLPDWAVMMGAWAIGIGVHDQNPMPPNAAGHVVALCENYMIDLSIDQAARRLKKMDIKPAIYQLPPEFKPDVKEVLQYYQGKCLLSYRFRPDLNTYHDSPDFVNFKQRYKEPTGRIIRAMRKGLM